MGNYNDVLMEQLADNGDGLYAYVDNIREAERLFVHNLTGTLETVARDAKIQVEFNAEAVERYRLMGFENRAIDDDDFRNDTVDAGEIGSGHSVTALYELKLADDVTAEIGVANVYLRWQDPTSLEFLETSREVVVGAIARSYEDTGIRFQMANTVAAYAEVVRSSYWASHLDLDSIAREADRIAALLDDDDFAEFAELVSVASFLTN